MSRKPANRDSQHITGIWVWDTREQKRCKKLRISSPQNVLEVVGMNEGRTEKGDAKDRTSRSDELLLASNNNNNPIQVSYL